MAKNFTLRAGYEPRIGTCKICGGKLKAKGLCHSHFASERRRILKAEQKLINQTQPQDLWEFVKKELKL